MGRSLHCFQDNHGGCGLSVDKKNVAGSISENTVISLKPFAVADFSIILKAISIKVFRGLMRNMQEFAITHIG